MIHAILPFLTAIALSGIAAYYSVIGLAQIFPGSYWPIIIMGSVLEAAKLVTVIRHNLPTETAAIYRSYIFVTFPLASFQYNFKWAQNIIPFEDPPSLLLIHLHQYILL